jgi:hypothetical protein
MKTTDKELVVLLETARLDPRYNRFPTTVYRMTRVIESAKNGEYHDIRSKSAHPKLDLTIELRTMGLTELADMVERGEFNEYE